MIKLSDHLRVVVHQATVPVLVAVLAVCLFAFVAGADGELVSGLLAIGLLTAFLETGLRVRPGDD